MNDLSLHDEELPAIAPTTRSLRLHFQHTLKQQSSLTLFNPDRLTRSDSYQEFQSPAAVLIPIIEVDAQLRILLTIRNSHLNKHAGQISFPGGRVDIHDADATSAALRESFEEINLLPQQVDVLGTLNHYVTGTGFRITPVVGLIESSFIPQHNENEVSATFTVPLHFLMNPSNYELQIGNEQNQHRSFYSISYENNHIWGATAAILFGLYETLLSSHPF